MLKRRPFCFAFIEYWFSLFTAQSIISDHLHDNVSEIFAGQ